MENMCSNCGFYKTLPLFWGGSTEPSLCDCPKEKSYSEEEVLKLILTSSKIPFRNDINKCKFYGMMNNQYPKLINDFKYI